MRGSRWPLIEAISGVKTHLEEAAQSLVAEIVEAQVLRLSRRLTRLQASLKFVGGHRGTRACSGKR